MFPSGVCAQMKAPVLRAHFLQLQPEIISAGIAVEQIMHGGWLLHFLFVILIVITDIRSEIGGRVAVICMRNQCIGST